MIIFKCDACGCEIPQYPSRSIVAQGVYANGMHHYVHLRNLCDLCYGAIVGELRKVKGFEEEGGSGA